jgi:hypothetical protein
MVIRCLVLSVLLLFASTAFAATITYTAILSGPGESPPNNSPGTGLATVIIDTTAHTMTISVTFSGLTGTTTASHIHCCTPSPLAGTAGVATLQPAFTNFPLNVTSGTMPVTVFDLTNTATYNAPFVTASGGTAAGAEAALLAGLAADQAYFNIHTSTFGGGEIRGFLIAPEPSTLSLLVTGFFGMLAGFRFYPRRRIMDS